MRIPGFRFYPTDEELVMYHLKRKVLGKKRSQVIGEIYIYKYAPWDLPDRSLLRTGDLKWYFFCPVQKKFAGSDKVNRCMDLGYWTTSGKDRKVHHNSVVVGRIRSLFFHKGKSPNGERTDWVMHEYKLEGNEWAKKGIAQDMYVLCVIFKKDGLGPKNGAQYGAPFKEEDWDSEEEVELGDRHFSSIGVSTLALATQDNPSTSHVPFNYVPENMSVGQSTSCPLETLPPVHHTMVPDTNANAEASQIVAENDDILEMLDVFFEESELLAQQPENSDRVGNPVEGVQTDKCIDGNNFDNDLANLAVFGQPESNALPSGLPAAFYGDQTFPDDNSLYWGPTDLDVPLNCLSGLNSIGLQRVDSPVEGFQTDKCIDGNNFDNDLANLAEFGQPESNGLAGGLPAAFYGDQTFPDGNSHYLELTDLDVPLNCLSGLNSIGLQRVDSPVEGFQTDICIDGNDFDNDLANLAGFGQPESNAIPGGLPAAFCGDQTFPDDNSLYLELRDLDVPLTCLSGLNSIGLQRVGDLANLAGFDQLESNAIPGGFPAAFYGDQTFPQDNSPSLELMDLDVPPNCLSGDSPMEGV